jgi:hypothetical protein
MLPYEYGYTADNGCGSKTEKTEEVGMATEQETATAGEHGEHVEVTTTITDPDGGSTTAEKTIPGGPTPVPTVKQELGVAEADSLFIAKDGKKKLLPDHEEHNVKAGDHYEVVGKGGVS